MVVDLVFPIICHQAIPADHGYLVYSALSRLLPDTHQADGFGIHPIAGRQLDGRTLQLIGASRLAIRVDAYQIARFLPLAGKPLHLLDRLLRLGVPQIRPLIPAAALRSRLVTIKLTDAVGMECEAARATFQAAIGRKLQELEISAAAQATLLKRRTVRIRDKEVFGYEVLIEGLAGDESLRLQERGLGGRRHMGCGIFVPMRALGTGT